MTDSPVLSIITPTYNGARFLPRNLASVAGIAGVEHIVVDAGSDDGTVTMLKASDSKWISEPDDGQSDALNKGMAMAQGDWVGWLNADEFYLPGVLTEWVARRMASTSDSFDVEYGDFIEVDLNSNSLGLRAQHHYSGYISEVLGCYIPSCATFLRKSSVQGVGGFDTSLKTIMDWDLWLRLQRSGAKFQYSPGARAGFTRHDGQVTTVLAEKSVREHALVRERLGIILKPWSKPAARSLRIASKMLEGGYLRELRARALVGSAV